MARAPGTQAPGPPGDAGFTLLEIMLVLLIMALATATVLPNLFTSASAGLADEGRRLRQVLRLAMEEAQLRGVPVRWTAYANRYVFEIPDGTSEWRSLREKPFAPDSLPEKIRIESVQSQDGLPWSGRSVKRNMPLGQVTLLPDGMLTPTDVTLASPSDHLRIRLRPGPAGIRIVEHGQ